MAMDSTAMEDFSKAKRKAKFQGILSALQWKNNDLMSLYEVTSIIKPKSETYLGMRTIPVSRIIGSEGRYHDFSSAFLPKREQLRSRWCSIDSAMMSDVVLPPISVYSLGGYYFVDYAFVLYPSALRVCLASRPDREKFGFGEEAELGGGEAHGLYHVRAGFGCDEGVGFTLCLCFFSFRDFFFGGDVRLFERYFVGALLGVCVYLGPFGGEFAFVGDVIG